MPSSPAPSPASPPGRADSRRNRAAILDAALALVVGDQPATMAEVARASGVTRATLYRHFPDREALVGGLLLRTAEQELPAVLGSLAEPDLGRAVHRLAAAVVAAGHRHRPLLRASGLDLEQLARSVVPDEPLAVRLAQWRADGQLGSPSSDTWLALAARALCLVAVADDRPPDDVAADLGEALRRLLA